MLLRRFACAVITWSIACPASAALLGHGSIYVSSLPPGAAVWMDGRYVGDTPLFVDGIAGGRHEILLVRSGWQPQRVDTDVAVGRVTDVGAVLQANPGVRNPGHAKGILQIRDVGTAKVYLDGNAIESFSGQSLDAGDHILSILRGTVRTSSSVRVYPDTVTSISLAAQSSGAAQGTTANNELANLTDYVPPNDFIVSGDTISVHFKNFELECTVGSLAYTLNGKPGTLSVAPEMVGDKPYLPVDLLNRITGAQPAGR